jgi:hypothetical protein
VKKFNHESSGNHVYGFFRGVTFTDQAVKSVPYHWGIAFPDVRVNLRAHVANKFVHFCVTPQDKIRRRHVRRIHVFDELTSSARDAEVLHGYAEVLRRMSKLCTKLQNFTNQFVEYRPSDGSY